MWNRNNRREFLRTLAVPAAAAALSGSAFAAPARKMRMCLNVGHIGARVNLQQAMELAAKFGFESVDPNLKELAGFTDAAMSRLFDDLQSKKLKLGSASEGIPVTQPEEKFSAYIKNLPQTAKTLQRARMTRFCTWVSPFDNNLTYLQNFRLQARRFREVATVLGDHGVRFGLEYVGPKTSWTGGRYPFVHNMVSMKELIAEIGKPNMGFLLDSWHWYTSGETAADLLTLKNSDIVNVHLNDAPAGIPVDQQDDHKRELPLATGVIDAGTFLNALNQVGYDGPVAIEPMSAELRKLPPEESVAKTSEAMHKAFALVK